MIMLQFRRHQIILIVCVVFLVGSSKVSQTPKFRTSLLYNLRSIQEHSLSMRKGEILHHPKHPLSQLTIRSQESTDEHPDIHPNPKSPNQSLIQNSSLNPTGYGNNMVMIDSYAIIPPLGQNRSFTILDFSNDTIYTSLKNPKWAQRSGGYLEYTLNKELYYTQIVFCKVYLLDPKTLQILEEFSNYREHSYQGNAGNTKLKSYLSQEKTYLLQVREAADLELFINNTSDGTIIIGSTVQAGFTNQRKIISVKRSGQIFEIHSETAFYSHKKTVPWTEYINIAHIKDKRLFAVKYEEDKLKVVKVLEDGTFRNQYLSTISAKDIYFAFFIKGTEKLVFSKWGTYTSIWTFDRERQCEFKGDPNAVRLMSMTYMENENLVALLFEHKSRLSGWFEIRSIDNLDVTLDRIEFSFSEEVDIYWYKVIYLNGTLSISHIGNFKTYTIVDNKFKLQRTIVQQNMYIQQACGNYFFNRNLKTQQIQVLHQNLTISNKLKLYQQRPLMCYENRYMVTQYFYLYYFYDMETAEHLGLLPSYYHNEIYDTFAYTNYMFILTDQMKIFYKTHWQGSPFGLWLNLTTFPIRRINRLSEYKYIRAYELYPNSIYCGTPQMLTNSSTWTLLLTIDCKEDFDSQRILVYENIQQGTISPSSTVNIQNFLISDYYVYPQIKLNKNKQFLMVYGITLVDGYQLPYLEIRSIHELNKISWSGHFLKDLKIIDCEFSQNILIVSLVNLKRLGQQVVNKLDLTGLMDLKTEDIQIKEQTHKSIQKHLLTSMI